MTITDLPDGFDTEDYLRLNDDVRRAGMDAAEHFLQFGRAEGRQWKLSVPVTLAPSDLVSDYWSADRSGARPVSWLEHSAVRTTLQRRISGDPLVGSLGWFQRDFIPKTLPLCLSLGCGLGAFERTAIRSGVAEYFHASDISEGAIEKARELATDADLGGAIDYSVVDLDAPDLLLPAATYDAIFGISSIHHVSQLENLFRQCRAALKPGGLMFLDEYVGPNRFQSPPHLVEIINKIRNVFPLPYRNNLLNGGHGVVGDYVPTPVEHFERTDPSEAIRSQDIIKALSAEFEIVAMRPYGGAIQHMLLSGVVGNFDECDGRDVAMLRLVALFEEELERAGGIESDFAALVARPR